MTQPDSQRSLNASPEQNEPRVARLAGSEAPADKPRSKLTREFIAEFAAGVERGAELRLLARAAGFHERTIQAWIEIGRGSRDTWPGSEAPVQAADLELCQELHEAVERAHSVKTNRMLESIHYAATTLNPKTLHPDWRAADTWLSKHPRTRGDWHDSDKTLRVTHVQSAQDVLAEALDSVALDEAAAALSLPVHATGSVGLDSTGSVGLDSSDTDSTARAVPNGDEE